MITDNKYLWIGIGVAALAIVYMVAKPGAAKSVGQAVGGAAVDLAEGTAEGVVGGIGDMVGLPTPDETITDEDQCLLYLNEHGYWAASAKCSAPAFLGASIMAMNQ